LGTCSCNVGYSGSDCNTAAAALPDGSVELNINTFIADTTPDAIGSVLGLPSGSVTVISTRSGSGGSTTIVIAIAGNNTAAAAQLVSLVGISNAEIVSLGITSARSGDGAAVNLGDNLSDDKPTKPISDGVAIALVIIGLVVVIVIVSLIWYACANSRDHIDSASKAPSGRPASASVGSAGTGMAAVELQVR